MSRRFLRDQRGGAGLEAALVAPVLLAMTMGAADVGTMLLQRHKMKAGLAAGARLLAHAADPASLEATARNLATTGRAAGGGAAVVPGWTPDQVAVSYRLVANTGGQYIGGSTIRVVRMQTSRTYTGFGLLGLLGAGSLAMSAAHEERWTGG